MSPVRSADKIVAFQTSVQIISIGSTCTSSIMKCKETKGLATAYFKYKEHCVSLSIALRIYLTFHVSVSKGDYSFSKLKRIKSELCATMQQNSLNSLAIISTEIEILELINFNDIIDDFAKIKGRKKFYSNFQHQCGV
jgi:hypothetical protein